MIHIVLLAFLCELVDSTLGMGYGTTLTPLLLLLGYSPLQVVPVVLLSDLVTGVAAAFFHHRLGNSDFRLGSQDLKVGLVFAGSGAVAAVAAIVLAVKVPEFWLTLYIGAMVTLIRVRILLMGNRQISFSWPRIIGIGLLAAFNKGLSGGGYGPLVTGGQLLSGQARNAVGITSLAEAAICLVAVVGYALSGAAPDLALAPYLLFGALLSTPVSAMIVRELPLREFRRFVGAATPSPWACSC
ncbi:sulfite exporter TauE/SafE family protein [Limnochorda pilosa]|uniref:Probable membrane transporter protein n=1 Tax=Limnochorda pilosa TaxID=1555112 RepID=A0A0K2SLV4_LIMPI|nr:sulfite exporter TauE/SafE family protein [Limnochorda pilosa]BAS28098.1 hypothetical protein LIP_2257 [Limnochorda pilosa]